MDIISRSNRLTLDNRLRWDKIADHAGHHEVACSSWDAIGAWKMIVFDQIESCIIDQSITLWCHGTLSSFKLNCPWDPMKETEPSFLVEGVSHWRIGGGTVENSTLWMGCDWAEILFASLMPSRVSLHINKKNKKLILQQQPAIEIDRTWNNTESLRFPCAPPFGCNGSMDGS